LPLCPPAASPRRSATRRCRASRRRKPPSPSLKACHELTNCIITLEADEALAAAKAADAAIAAAPPRAARRRAARAQGHVRPQGQDLELGRRIRATQPAAEDATPIARFKAAGALQIAALHLTEFAFGPTGHNYVLGHARNPWDPTRITGGSSAGTGCSVAYGAIAAGMGSDTGGSLRLPAAACGITSIKPTWGRVSRAGAMPLAPALDTVGVLARHVEDLALTLGFLAGPDARDPAATGLPVPDYVAHLGDPVAGLRVGVDEVVVRDANPQVQRMLEEVLAILGKLGLQRASCRFPDWQTLDQLVQLVQMPDAAAGHNAHMRTRAQDFGPQVRARLEVGHFIPAVDHMTALRARGTYLQRTLDTTFKGLDIAILPILADPLPTIAELDVAGGPQLQAAMGRVVKYTRPVNYLGLPTLALPVPRNGGLPNGIQLIGRPYRRGAAVRHRPSLPARGAARDRPANHLTIKVRIAFRVGVPDASPPVRLFHLLQRTGPAGTASPRA
jgi:aspartyl-tRNA(Asn)/glutamyl-tRNA(Gln) amidotransferase subunit A